MNEVNLIQLVRYFFEENKAWPKFTYGEFSDSGMVYVYHNDLILAFLNYDCVVVRAPGSYYNYCGSLVVPLFDRYTPEHPEFLTQVSNAIDVGIRLIENGKPELS